MKIYLKNIFSYIFFYDWFGSFERNSISFSNLLPLNWEFEWRRSRLVLRKLDLSSGNNVSLSLVWMMVGMRFLSALTSVIAFYCLLRTKTSHIALAEREKESKMWVEYFHPRTPFDGTFVTAQCIYRIVNLTNWKRYESGISVPVFLEK